jgi:pimeloyl-ACP methyl ester carboxylesterase
MVALRWAARYPEDVASLIISAVQIRPPRLVIWLQTAVMRLIPAGAFGGDEDGVTKTTVLQAMRELRRADLRPDLARVRAPTLVTCGAKDGFNLAASRVAAAGITGAELRIVPGAKHLWNQDLPDLFNRTLVEWVGRSSAEAQ